MAQGVELVLLLLFTVWFCITRDWFWLSLLWWRDYATELLPIHSPQMKPKWK